MFLCFGQGVQYIPMELAVERVTSLLDRKAGKTPRGVAK
jgi:hypothetical protein